MSPPGPTLSYYDVLGIPRDAKEADIRKAYLRKAAQCHPDKNQDDPNAKETFQAVAEAYECLSSPTERAGYDRKLDSANLPLPHMPPPRHSHEYRPFFRGPGARRGGPTFESRRGAKKSDADGQYRRRGEWGKFDDPYAGSGFVPTFSYTAPEDGWDRSYNRPGGREKERERARYQPPPNYRSHFANEDEADLLSSDDIYLPSPYRRHTGHRLPPFPPFPSPFMLHNILRSTFAPRQGRHGPKPHGFGHLDSLFPIPPFAEIERMLQDLGVDMHRHESAARARAANGARMRARSMAGSGGLGPHGIHPDPHGPRVHVYAGPAPHVHFAPSVTSHQPPVPGVRPMPGAQHGMPPLPPIPSERPGPALHHRGPVAPLLPRMPSHLGLPPPPHHEHGMLISPPAHFPSHFGPEPHIRQASYRFASPDGNVRGVAHVSHATWSM